MVLHNPTGLIVEKEGEVTTTVSPTAESPPVPVGKAVGFSIGLVLIWCGQLGVYKFHDQVIEKDVINAGERYVSFAHHID